MSSRPSKNSGDTGGLCRGQVKFCLTGTHGKVSCHFVLKLWSSVNALNHARTSKLDSDLEGAASKDPTQNFSVYPLAMSMISVNDNLSIYIHSLNQM